MEGHPGGQAGGSFPSSLNPGSGGFDHPQYPGCILNTTFPADRSVRNVISRYFGYLSSIRSGKERKR